MDGRVVRKMLERFSMSYPAYTGEEERNIYVYVPDDFEEDETLRFPVLYMFDGHNVFYDEDATYGKSWGMKGYLDATQTPLIVVGVECNHTPDGARLSEYSPYSFRTPKTGSIEGRGRDTMEWIVRTLKPMIDEQYPTLLGRYDTFIAGSSMGGLMSLYAVMQYNHVFSRAAALSPSVWVAPRRLEKLLRDAPIRPDTVVYMDYGSREMSHHADMLRRYTTVARLLLERGVHLTSRIVPNGNHNEASWERQIPFFINTLLYDWQH